MLLFKIKRDEILKPLQSIIGIVERRHTLPILSYVLIEKFQNQLTFTATDLEIQIATTTDFENSEIDFAITVSAKKLLDICRTYNEDTIINFEKDDNKIFIKANKSRFNLQTLPSNDFPKITNFIESKISISLTQKKLKELFDQVQYAIAIQDLRYYLNGLLLIAESETIKLIATDGHRLSMISHQLLDKINTTTVEEIIIPRKSIIEVNKLLNNSEDQINIEIGQNQVRFKFSNTLLISKIIEGKFPDYNKVIPTNYQNVFTISRINFLQALLRVSILTNEKFSGVRLILSQNCLRILCNNSEQEEAQEELEIEYNGIPLDIGFNIKYLLDVLNNYNFEKITCSFGEVNSSGFFTIPDNDNFKYVVMPMRI